MRIGLLSAPLLLTAACSSANNSDPVTVTSYSVAITTALPASAMVGASIPVAFAITEHRSDATSGPAAGKSFSVAVTAGAGTINASTTATITTASDGSASLTWVLGPTAGTQTVRGSVSTNVFVDVSIATTPGPATRLTLKAQPLPLGLIGTVLSPQPAVQLQDFGSNSVAQAGVSITASIGAGAGTLGGTVTIPTDASGRATFTSLVVSGVAGPVTLAFSATLGGQLATVSSSSISVRTPWLARASLLTARYGLGVAVVNGTLYAIGGQGSSGILGTVEVYDPVANTWSTRAPMPVARWFPAVGVVNGIVYAVGGYGPTSALGTVEAYDPATNTWTAKAAMPTPRGGLAIGVVNGILYAVGGFNTNDDPVATVEAYDPATNTWTTRAGMPTGAGELAAGVIGGVLYVVAGDGQETLMAYEPVANSWTVKGVLPTQRYDAGVAVVNGLLYVVGGTPPRGSTPLGLVEVYNPATNTWTTSTTAVSPRGGLGVGVINGTLYAVGGTAGTSSPVGIVEVFGP